MRQTTLLREVLSKYRNPIFVETGTASGGGVAAAMVAGFNRIYSIEISQEKQLKNVERFRGIKNVTLITGDSSEEVWRIIPLIDSPATFWLDAHFEKKKPKCPLYEELDAIASSPIKTHTILIDDMRVIGKEVWGKKVSKEEIIDKILVINKDYKISFEDNTMAENDIMVATL